MVESMVKEKMGGRKKEYVAYLTVRVPPNGYVTVKLLRHDVGLRARVGIVGRVPEPPRFGPWPEWVNILKAFLAAPGIVIVKGDTYPLRSLLASLGYWFDKENRVYRRSPVDAGCYTAVTPQPARR